MASNVRVLTPCQANFETTCVGNKALRHQTVDLRHSPVRATSCFSDIYGVIHSLTDTLRLLVVKNETQWEHLRSDLVSFSWRDLIRTNLLGNMALDIWKAQLDINFLLLSPLIEHLLLGMCLLSSTQYKHHYAEDANPSYNQSYETYHAAISQVSFVLISLSEGERGSRVGSEFEDSVKRDLIHQECLESAGGMGAAAMITVVILPGNTTTQTLPLCGHRWYRITDSAWFCKLLSWKWEAQVPLLMWALNVQLDFLTKFHLNEGLMQT